MSSSVSIPVLYAQKVRRNHLSICAESAHLYRYIPSTTAFSLRFAAPLYRFKALLRGRAVELTLPTLEFAAPVDSKNALRDNPEITQVTIATGSTPDLIGTPSELGGLIRSSMRRPPKLVCGKAAIKGVGTPPTGGSSKLCHPQHSVLFSTQCVVHRACQQGARQTNRSGSDQYGRVSTCWLTETKSSHSPRPGESPTSHRGACTTCRATSTSNSPEQLPGRRNIPSCAPKVELVLPKGENKSCPKGRTGPRRQGRLTKVKH